MGEIERTNVIIVGAGASAEFGLPTGETLKDKIRELSKTRKIDGWERFSDGVLGDCFPLLSSTDSGQSLKREATIIGQSIANAPSIDNYLHTHSDNKNSVTVGKLLIARSIFIAEEESTLYVTDRNNADLIDFDRGEYEIKPDGPTILSPKWSWLGQYFKLLVAEKRYDDFVNSLKNVTFISFNYDRCIKQYLLYAARQYFRLNPNQVQEVNAAIKIIHPYGSIGDLFVGGGAIRGFGEHPTCQGLIDVSEGLRTFTEGIDSDDIKGGITEAFSNCEVAIFLGFGYLPLNMNLLFKDKSLNNLLFEVPNVYGTSLGMSEESTNIVVDELYDWLVLGDPQGTPDEREGQVKLSSITCRELFVKHHRSLLGR